MVKRDPVLQWCIAKKKKKKNSNMPTKLCLGGWLKVFEMFSEGNVTEFCCDGVLL